MISIIVPVYNVEKTLELCVKSILNQTYKDFELLLIDDGSTDKSSMICDSFTNVDSRIKVYHKQNEGLSETRNFGIKHSVGDYILFIDSDDFIHKDFCKSLISLKDSYNAQIISSDIVHFRLLDELDELNKMKREQKIEIYEGDNILKEYFFPKSSIRIFHTLCNKLYDRKLFKDLWFEKGRLHEDLYITYKLLNRSNKLILTNYPYYFYFRGNENSICNNYGEKNLIDQYNATMNMYSDLRNNANIYHELVYFVINQFLNWITLSKKIIQTENVNRIKKSMTAWIEKNYKKCKYLSIKKRIRIFIMLKLNIVL